MMMKMMMMMFAPQVRKLRFFRGAFRYTAANWHMKRKRNV